MVNIDPLPESLSTTAMPPLISTNRIPPEVMFALSLIQREVESSALIGGTLGPDLAAVAVNDSLHRGQPDP